MLLGLTYQLVLLVVDLVLVGTRSDAQLRAEVTAITATGSVGATTAPKTIAAARLMPRA